MAETIPKLESFMRWMTVLTQVLEVYFFGGLVFGFNTLVYILKKESIFSELCLNSTRSVGNNSLALKFG